MFPWLDEFSTALKRAQDLGYFDGFSDYGTEDFNLL